MKTADLQLKQYRTEGDIRHQYNPLHNIKNADGTISDFNTKELNTEQLHIDLSKPLDLQCQPSYDGTVNLIINDDTNPPRIINSRFSVIEDNRYRVINRNQREQTNLYDVTKIDQQTRLFRTINKIPRIELKRVLSTGCLPGGNYTFYIKYADNDYNKTDVVAESSIVTICNGNVYDPKTISGTLSNEQTDKAVNLKLLNIDDSFYKFYVYYVREYSDVNGSILTEAKQIKEPFDLVSGECTITGFEATEAISPEELNINYLLVDSVKTQAQVQNMLFFGNVASTTIDNATFQDLSYYINVSLTQEKSSIGWVNSDYETKLTDGLLQSEYYSYKNIYYKLGYWPDEFYRMGVVYIMNNDALTPVYNLRGIAFNWNNPTNVIEEYDKENPKINRNVVLDESTLDNTWGVFKNPSLDENHQIINYEDETVKPWYYRMSIPDNVKYELKQLGVKGLFFVRQKRLPFVICQGLSIGIDQNAHIPMLFDGKTYFTEGFIDENQLLTHNFTRRKLTASKIKGSGLLSLDACVTPQIQSLFDGTNFILKQTNSITELIKKDRHFSALSGKFETSFSTSANCAYINEGVPSKVIDDVAFSTRAGMAEDVREFSFLIKDDYSKENQNLVRGIYCPFVATIQNLNPNKIYTVFSGSYNSTYNVEYVRVRGESNLEFFAISDRWSLDDVNTVDCYRGDCFTTTNTIRINRNFVDSELPIMDRIIDEQTWSKGYKGYKKMSGNVEDDSKTDEDEIGYWSDINRGDLNAVQMGMWVTYKSLSNYNLGLRAPDRRFTDETALMGNVRSFYPLSGMSVKSGAKIAESFVLNSGYNSLLGKKRHYKMMDVPYIRDLFDTRLMFSNVQTEDSYKNAYRIFQGLSFTDLDRQFGALVKILPWKADLLGIFEHGVGIIPVNPKALLQTQQGQSIHLYGSNVLESQVSVINSDFGTIWPESVIQTPIGVYGVDTYGKKIWRVSQSGMEIISDIKIQQYLNDHIQLSEDDKYPTISLLNVKSHYNNHKGDVIFTFYNYKKDEEWSICYNERLNLWTTKYSWTPLYSENINNVFYSLDKKRAEILAIIFDNNRGKRGVTTTENEWDLSGNFTTEITLDNYKHVDEWTANVVGIKTSYISDKEIDLSLSTDLVNMTYDVENKKFLLTLDKSKLEFEVSTIEDLNTPVPLYYKIDVIFKGNVKLDSEDKTYDKEIFATIGVVVNPTKYNGTEEERVILQNEYNKLIRNWFYVHGKAGIFDEINYTDDDKTNQILPTMWYEKQEPFEFEFVVNEPLGLHKIFNNLVIISNNVAPEEIEYEIVGDVYDFKKLIRAGEEVEFKNTRVEYDYRLNQYLLVTNQKCKNITEYGRLKGNIQYKEDSWNLVIDPIIKKKNGKSESARLRDKWVKIKIKYKGDNLVLVSAINTIITLSYA